MNTAEDKKQLEIYRSRYTGFITLEREVFTFIHSSIVNVLRKIDAEKIQTLEEIRLRANRPLMIQNCDGDFYVSSNGKLSKTSIEPIIISQNDIFKSLELMCESSIYAYQEEIKSGYITLKGGHRVGLAGRIVMGLEGIKHLKDISGLNIRISKQVIGCATNIIKHLISDTGEVQNTLIISPPQCGKTTLLRDLTRIISDGHKPCGLIGQKVGIIDERSELAACYKGVPQNIIGNRTDVLDGCPKKLGMELMLRSMSPQIVVTDEIGNQGDSEAIFKILNAGIKIITTAHGYGILDLKSRQEVLELLNQKVFERFIIMDKSKGPGTVKQIINGSNLEVLYNGTS